MQRASTQSHTHTYASAAPTNEPLTPSLLDHVIDATLPPLLATITAPTVRVSSADYELAYVMNDLRSFTGTRIGSYEERYCSLCDRIGGDCRPAVRMIRKY
jgi:hypothetical protein